MTNIYNNLYQFTEDLEPFDLSLHKYLLLADEPVLVHTGTAMYAETLIPQLKELLGDRPLKYVLVSHFESDECGGLSLLLNAFPEATVVCSEVTARQFFGFLITYKPMIKKPDETLEGDGYRFEFLDYPSEMHLWNGLLFFETQQGILFSSDLMFTFGRFHGDVAEKDWASAIAAGGLEMIPDVQAREKLAQELHALSPQFVATGHGPCIKL